jgi:hypothetical protein
VLDLNALFDLNSLPLAPEFAETLAENATETAAAALEALHVPENLILLVRNIHELGYYLEECYRSPNPLLHERRNRFDIEAVAVETINAIAQSGGVFHGPVGDTLPRETPTPVQFEQPA